MNTPVLVSVYHRLNTFKRCIGALQNNAEARATDLFIVSDGAGRIEDEVRVASVRRFAHGISGFRSVSVIERPENWGANRSVMEAIGELLGRFGQLIFMEDDILPSSHFLEFMNHGLNVYRDDATVFAVCGYKAPFKMPRFYTKDVFFLERYCPWGIGLWADKFFQVNHGEFDRYSSLKKEDEATFRFLQKNDPSFLGILQGDSEGLIKAADVRIEYHLCRTHKMCVYPAYTMTNVMDSGEDSMHSTVKWIADEPLRDTCPKDLGLIDRVMDERIYMAFLKGKYPTLIQRFWFSIFHNGILWTLRYYWGRLSNRKTIEKDSRFKE